MSAPESAVLTVPQELLHLESSDEMQTALRTATKENMLIKTNLNFYANELQIS